MMKMIKNFRFRMSILFVCGASVSVLMFQNFSFSGGSHEAKQKIKYYQGKINHYARQPASSKKDKIKQNSILSTYENMNRTMSQIYIQQTNLGACLQLFDHDLGFDVVPGEYSFAGTAPQFCHPPAQLAAIVTVLF